MKKIAAAAAALLFIVAIGACSGPKAAGTASSGIPEGEFIFNLPCKVIGINQDKPGRSIMFLWLHGGVSDVPKHSFFEFNHLDCVAADDSIVNYLTRKGMKAIALFPVCHQASVEHAVTWYDCYSDVKAIMDSFIDKGLVDTDRIYLAGSSDGGVGTWDFVEHYPDYFAVAISQSCSRPHKTTVPVYFFNTRSESDATEAVKELTDQGCPIYYKRCPDVGHGGDSRECTEEFLDKYFSYRRSDRE